MPRFSSLIFATLMALPSATFGQSALEVISGDWGVETLPDSDCATYPIRLELTGDRKVVGISFPNHAQLFQTIQAPVLNAQVLSVEGPLILIHNDIRNETSFIFVFDDGASLKMGQYARFSELAMAPVYTRCPETQPDS